MEGYENEKEDYKGEGFEEVTYNKDKKLEELVNRDFKDGDHISP